MVITDGGQALSHTIYRQSLEGVCAARALAIAGQVSFDAAFDRLLQFDNGDLGSNSLALGDGMYFEEWARKAGWLQYWRDEGSLLTKRGGVLASDMVECEPRTIWLEWLSLSIAKKGVPRVYPEDLPSVIPEGRFVVSSEGHVEAWIDGVWHDRPGIAEEIKAHRVCYGAWRVHELQPGEVLWQAFRVYVIGGTAYRSALGPVPGKSESEAYGNAEVLFGHRITGRKADILLEEVRRDG